MKKQVKHRVIYVTRITKLTDYFYIYNKLWHDVCENYRIVKTGILVFVRWNPSIVTGLISKYFCSYWFVLLAYDSLN